MIAMLVMGEILRSMVKWHFLRTSRTRCSETNNNTPKLWWKRSNHESVTCLDVARASKYVTHETETSAKFTATTCSRWRHWFSNADRMPTRHSEGSPIRRSISRLVHGTFYLKSLWAQRNMLLSYSVWKICIAICRDPVGPQHTILWFRLWHQPLMAGVFRVQVF